MSMETMDLSMYDSSLLAAKYKGQVPADTVERRELYISIVHKFTALQRSFLAAYIHHNQIRAACEECDIEVGLPAKWENDGVNWKYAAALAQVDSTMVSSHMVEQAQIRAMQTLIDLLDSKDPKVRIQAANSLSKISESSKVKEVKHTHAGDIGINVDYKNTLMRMVEGEAVALGSEEDVAEAVFREVPPPKLDP